MDDNMQADDQVVGTEPQEEEETVAEEAPAADEPAE